MAVDNEFEKAIAYLRSRGAAETSHSNRMLLKHLIGTWEQLAIWGARRTLCDAGLFHSVYGTEHFEPRLQDGVTSSVVS